MPALEHLAPLLGQRTLSSWAHAKAAGPQARDWDWEQYVDSNGGALNDRLEQRWKAFFSAKVPAGDVVE